MDTGIIPWHRQPFKTLYVTYLITFLVLIKLPWWALYFVPINNRPSPTWSWGICMKTRLLRSIFPFLIRGGLITSVHVSPDDLPPMSNDEIGKMGFNCRSVLIPSVNDEDLHGEIKKWKERNEVTTVAVPGYWWGDQERSAPSLGDYPPVSGEKVIIHFHGGAYVLGTARPTKVPSKSLPVDLLKSCMKTPNHPVRRLLDVDYRLGRAQPIDVAANPFPTQLIDGLAAFLYVTRQVGFNPNDVILSGDSAGGNIALALTRYLRDSPSLPTPPTGGLLLSSPWCDLQCSHHAKSPLGQNASMIRNAYADIVPFTPYPGVGLSTYGAKAYRGKAISREEAFVNPYMSPGSLDAPDSREDMLVFGGYPRTYISVAGREILYDEILHLADRLKKDHVASQGEAREGSDWVTVSNEPEMIHDFCAMPGVGNEESKQELARMARWFATIP